MTTMKKYMLFLLSGFLTTSCLDTEVLPDSITIGEDMWKSKEDVSAMVNGAYQAMVANDVIERCVVWGTFRGDEVNHLTTTLSGVQKENDLRDIKAGQMTQTNMYADWASFYSVINKCNLVLEKAPGVVNSDPAYTQGSLNTDLSQMLALRSLCYFYLVRAFRDVPVTDGAYTESTQEREIPQQAPLTVLNKCVEDLEKAMKTPLSPIGYTDWRRVGYINRDGIAAILADVYLWRASMTHNAADYQKCVEYCDVVLNSKKEIYSEMLTMGGQTRRWPNLIYNGAQVYSAVFAEGNSAESIFELQMNGQANKNTGLRNCYWNYDDKSRSTGLMNASLKFGTLGSDGYFLSNLDFRYYESCVNVTKTDLPEFEIFKTASNKPITGINDVTTNVASSRSLDQNGYVERNWIVYRLSDVMLMKAEALVQLAPEDGAEVDPEDPTATNLRAAFTLVNEVNKRSLAKTSFAKADTIDFQANNNKAAMEELVLAERLRELCFEGKRYFDLLRYNYRHTEGVQPDRILADISEDPKAMLTNYKPMMDLMTRGMSEGSAAAAAKMPTEPYLYFPVLESELKANTKLKQNPAYKADDIYVKN